MLENRPANSRIPLWIKVAWFIWLLVWEPVYWRQYGTQNFLYFCDVGNFLIAIGLWTENRLILSWQAVGLLVFQTLYAIDLVGAALSGHHIIGGTEYMFDPKVSLLVRLLGLYHLIVPPLLLWAVRRLGYDERGWKLQTLTAWILVPINFFWRPQFNVNWARGLGHEQHVLPTWLYLAAYLIIVPLAVYWPTHWMLSGWAKRAPCR
ncbi:MAG: hypothetical protein ACRD3P_04360 [Terriglobales bacterium]